MEPDQLKTLREKINSLERQPVSWQKEFVWKQVAPACNTRLLIIRWKYAAALVLTGVIGYTILSYQQRVWETSSKRISALEKQIESEKNKIVNSHIHIEEKCVIVNDKPTLPLTSKRKTKNPILVEEPPVSIHDRIAINYIDSLSTSAPAFESVVMIEAKSQGKKIAPIIGKVPLNGLNVPGKERSVRIQLNKMDDTELPSSLEERNVLVARIQ
jgi:hypothetical protein